MRAATPLSPVAPKVLYRVSEAAEIMSVSRATVHRLMSSGKLSFVPIGKERRISYLDIEAFVTNERTRLKGAVSV